MILNWWINHLPDSAGYCRLRTTKIASSFLGHYISGLSGRSASYGSNALCERIVFGMRRMTRAADPLNFHGAPGSNVQDGFTFAGLAVLLGFFTVTALSKQKWWFGEWQQRLCCFNGVHQRFTNHSSAQQIKIQQSMMIFSASSIILQDNAINLWFSFCCINFNSLRSLVCCSARIMHLFRRLLQGLQIWIHTSWHLWFPTWERVANTVLIWALCNVESALVLGLWRTEQSVWFPLQFYCASEIYLTC